jgi:serine/threonine-protein phosphatase 2B catalytic subunit
MEPLLDPVGDRVMKDIVPPPHKPIADELLYPNKCIEQFYRTILTFTLASTIPNWELLKNHMYREGRVSKEHCQKILRDTLALISNP